MKKIIVLIPTETESKYLVANGIRVSHCGAGMAECASTAARLICENRPDLMILAGTAGTYTDELDAGEVVAVRSETIADLGRRVEGGNGAPDTFTPLYQRTYNASVMPKGLKAVHSNTANTAGAIIAKPVEAAIENMEGAAFLAVCDRMGVPAMELRAVSNRVGECISGRNMEIAMSRLALELERILKSLV